MALLTFNAVLSSSRQQEHRAQCMQKNKSTCLEDITDISFFSELIQLTHQHLTYPIKLFTTALQTESPYTYRKKLLCSGFSCPINGSHGEHNYVGQLNRIIGQEWVLDRSKNILTWMQFIFLYNLFFLLNPCIKLVQYH